ncbi:MAG: class III lanthionine synthetase LanKC [Chloroflexota bacterium]
MQSNRAQPPAQGWKLHVSASVSSAESVLLNALPVLFEEDANFKLATSLHVLVKLNQGDAGYSQIGKFITVYPNDDDQAVRLAKKLDSATRGLSGPVVPSDRGLNLDSLVHYRYGAFDDRYIQTPVGDIVPALMCPDGRLIADDNGAIFNPPSWALDPFVAAGIAFAPPSTLLIGERYLIVATVQRAARGAIHLGADMTECRPCVIKEAYRAAAAGLDGRDACDRLRHEAAALQRFANDQRFPTVFDFIQQGQQLFLVMQDMVGHALHEEVNLLLDRGVYPSREQFIGWARQLCAILATVHAAGMVYRDVKASNIVVAPGGDLSLIDFELACEHGGSGTPFYGGTRGYTSPQQVRGCQPAISDDVYAIGALFYYLLTGADPSSAPHPSALTERRCKLMNPGIEPELEAIIEKCLDAESSKRFESMAELDHALARIEECAPSNGPLCRSEPIEESEGDIRSLWRDLARKIGDTLCRRAVPSPHFAGVTWVTPHHTGQRLPSKDLGYGSAGTVLITAELAATFGTPSLLRVLAEAADWLNVAPGPGGPALPGFYVGEAGIGTALLRSGQVLREGRLVTAAAQRARSIAALPYISPDLFNGTAGRVRFLLYLWDETSESEFLRQAVAAGHALLAGAEDSGQGALRWPIPKGYGGFSGNAYLGYAHGAAGIADVLLDLFEVTGEEAFLTTARGGCEWLKRLAISALDDNSGLNWPTIEDEKPRGAFWCHGATGVGKLFLHAAELGIFSDASELAARAGRTLAHSTRWAGPTQCHGLAGNIEFVLDLYQATGIRKYLINARCLARILETFASEQDGDLVWSGDDPTVFGPDYMGGYAGVASCLLRLADPENRPHVLSRRNFRSGKFTGCKSHYR